MPDPIVAAPAAVPAPIQEAAPVENQVQENKEATPPITKEEKKEIEKKLKKFQLKVDGEVEDFEIDLDNDEEVKKHLQMSKASQKRMKEANELRKAAEEFIDVLRKDPRKIMKELGLNEKELAEIIMNEQLAEMEKSPEQKEIEKLKSELQSRLDKEKKDEEERVKRERERLTKDTEEKIENDISSALESGGVAKTPYTVRKMAEMMYVALENDIDLKPQDVVSLVKKQMEADIKELFAASSDDVLEEFLKDQMPRIRKRNVAKAKTPTSVNNIKEPTGKIEAKKDEVKRITIQEFLKGKR